MRTSRSRGTLASRSGADDSSAAHMIGSAAFLAPDTRASPRSGTPPWIASLSMRGRVVEAAGRRSGSTCRSIRRESGEKVAARRGYVRAAQSSGVKVCIDSAWISSRMRVAERPVDELVLLHAALAAKRRTHDHRLEVVAVAGDLDAIAGEPLLDVAA